MVDAVAAAAAVDVVVQDDFEMMPAAEAAAVDRVPWLHCQQERTLVERGTEGSVSDVPHPPAAVESSFSEWTLQASQSQHLI